jgi:predicted dehydrogenase
VTAVSKEAGTQTAIDWIEKGFIVVSETPAAPDFCSFEKLKSLPEDKKRRFITAEQYHLYPEYSALIKLVKSGIIGEISAVNLLVAHDYHAASLIREFLNTGVEDKFDVTSKDYEFPVVRTLTRRQSFFDGQIENKKRTIAAFDFENGKSAFYDFDSEQYRSPVRKNTLKIQGVRGEIIDRKVYYLDEKNRACESEIIVKTRNVKRKTDNPNFQNIEEVVKIIFEGKKLYASPFGRCGLTQDETAVALLLKKTYDYVTGKAENPYPLEKALSDSYMALKMREDN